jgi:hypothetical protein
MQSDTFESHLPETQLMRNVRGRSRVWLGVTLLVAMASCKGDCSGDASPGNDAAPAASATPVASEAAAPPAVAPAASAAEAPPDARAPLEVSADAAAPAPRSSGGSGSPGGPAVKTPCPKVTVPSEGRFSACKAQGGTLTGIETDGCIRGYDCVKPPKSR